MDLIFKSKEGTKVLAGIKDGQLIYRLEGKESRNDLINLIRLDLRDSRNTEHKFLMQNVLDILLHGKEDYREPVVKAYIDDDGMMCYEVV